MNGIKNVMKETNDVELPSLAQAHTQKNPILKGHIVIDDVSVIFGKDIVAVENASLEILPGEFVCLLGPSGCGKSTLMNTVASFVKPTKGKVSVDGKKITKPSQDCGMVFQQHSLFPLFQQPVFLLRWQLAKPFARQSV